MYGKQTFHGMPSTGACDADVWQTTDLTDAVVVLLRTSFSVVQEPLLIGMDLIGIVNTVFYLK